MCSDLQILKYDTLKFVIVSKLLSKWLFKDGLTLESSAPLEKKHENKWAACYCACGQPYLLFNCVCCMLSVFSAAEENR